MDSTAEICQEVNVNKATKLFDSLRHVFHIITLTLLGLLLPLAFLLLARLTTAHYLLAVSNYPTKGPLPLIVSLFFYTDGTLQYILVASVTTAALVHLLTGRLSGLSPSIDPVSRPWLYAAWIFLCAFQVCVCLGIEGSIAAGIDASSFAQESGLFGRVVFFLGLHQTMLYWTRTVVKPVVDDTLFGFGRKQRWIEKVVMASSLGTLWWWRLRDEIESLVVVVKVKRELLMGVGIVDFAGWWLYYLTVIIGVARVVKGLLWVGTILLYRRVDGNTSNPPLENDDKV